MTGGKDHFNAYVVTTDATAAPQPTTHLGWDSRGHYVFYVVIGLASGDPITATDERTPLIISDIVETYLSTTVIGAREKTRGAGHEVAQTRSRRLRVSAARAASSSSAG